MEPMDLAYVLKGGMVVELMFNFTVIVNMKHHSIVHPTLSSKCSMPWPTGW